MNKIAIPALLVATVMVAGMFAFAPVEQASTVHTTIIGESMIPFIVDCAEVTIVDGSDDGEDSADDGSDDG